MKRESGDFSDPRIVALIVLPIMGIGILALATVLVACGIPLIVLLAVAVA